jgi:hypothetical protein
VNNTSTAWLHVGVVHKRGKSKTHGTPMQVFVVVAAFQVATRWVGHADPFGPGCVDVGISIIGKDELPWRQKIGTRITARLPRMV